MPKKRPSPKSSNDQQTNAGSHLFQHDDCVKRAKIASLNDTTLQDLPLELLEFILIKAVAMEVMDTKLAKSVWKEKADLVIDRLRAVCPQWSNILTTSFFRNELHRTLDRTAQKMTRLEILHQSPLQYVVLSMTTMNDEIFMLCKPPRIGSRINIYDRGNMAEVKAVIPLSRLQPQMIIACNVSNCLYTTSQKMRELHFSVWRIARDDENRFTVSRLVRDARSLVSDVALCVTASGCLILTQHQTEQRAEAITVFDANGAVLRKLRLPIDTDFLYNIIPRSNGNLVLATMLNTQTRLMEIDMNGVIIRQYQSSLAACQGVCRADNSGRILTVDAASQTELLDSEFNLIDSTGPQLGGVPYNTPYTLCHNSDRNEIVAIERDQNYHCRLLTVFRFT